MMRGRRRHRRTCRAFSSWRAGPEMSSSSPGHRSRRAPGGHGEWCSRGGGAAQAVRFRPGGLGRHPAGEQRPRSGPQSRTGQPAARPLPHHLRLPPHLPPRARRGRREDHVTRPFRATEILARAQILLHGRRPHPRAGMPRHGDLVLDDVVGSTRRDARRPLDLTPAEYRLLRHLLINAGQVLAKEQISLHVRSDWRATERCPPSCRRRSVAQHRPFPGPAHESVSARGLG